MPLTDALFLIALTAVLSATVTWRILDARHRVELARRDEIVRYLAGRVDRETRLRGGPKPYDPCEVER